MGLCRGRCRFCLFSGAYGTGLFCRTLPACKLAGYFHPTLQDSGKTYRSATRDFRPALSHPAASRLDANDLRAIAHHELGGNLTTTILLVQNW